jgi:capsular polysaccharide transport system permease protein
LDTKIGDHFLGSLWVITEPLVHIATLTIIFTFIRSRADYQGIPFAAFFATGILPFFIFQHTVQKSLRAMRQNRQLFSYRQVKPLDVIVVMTYVELFVYGIIFLLLMWVGVWFFNIDTIPHGPLEVVLIFILICLFSIGTGLICAVLGARWEDASTLIVQMPLRLLYFISGILIPMQALPVHLHKYLLWNPLLHGIEQIRAHTFEGYVAPGTSISFLALCTVANLFIGLTYFSMNRSRLLLLR